MAVGQGRCQTQGLPVLIIMGSPKMGQKYDFPGTQNRPFGAFLGPPGPRDPENLIRHVLFYNPVDFGRFWTDMKPFPNHLSVFTLRKHSTKTNPNKAPGAPWKASRDAHGTPGPPGTPPGTIRKVVRENA